VHLGGLDVLDNARLLCDQHHKQKTQEEAQAAKKKKIKLVADEPHPFDVS